MKQAFKNAAAAAFRAAGNIKETVTYKSKHNTNPTYVPGTNSITDAYTEYENIDMILTNYSVDEIAHLLRGARARVLNTAPLMDRAVTTVLKEYKNQ